MNCKKRLLCLTAAALLICLLPLLGSCRSGRKNAVQKLALRGMIYDWDNTPVGSAELTLESPDNPRFSKTALSDMTGRFDFGEVNPGSYVLTGTAKGYEDISETFQFGDARQILYIRAASGTQLLEKAYEALSADKYAEASSYVKRAEALDRSDRRALFYEALIDFEKGDMEEALRILAALEKKDASDVAVLIFTADIYQYGKDDTFNALKYLKKAALFSDEPEISERIKLIEKGEKK